MVARAASFPRYPCPQNSVALSPKICGAHEAELRRSTRKTPQAPRRPPVHCLHCPTRPLARFVLADARAKAVIMLLRLGRAALVPVFLLTAVVGCGDNSSQPVDAARDAAT